MEKIKCKNGHYYDPERHTNCPYCGVDINDFMINRESHTANYGNVNDMESYGKTLPIQDIMKEKQIEKKVEPVVGWLVVTSEKNRGMDYRILAGKNKIGKSSTNEIALCHDESVGQFEHANLIYDSYSSSFYLTLGEERGLVDLNGELILSDKKLKKDDHIRIGNTELLFIPFCSETFRW